MKVLLLSITAGGGHNATSNALKTCFESLGHECRAIDTYALANKLAYKVIADGYLLSIKYASGAFGYFYKKAENRRFKVGKNTLARRIGKALSKKIKLLIDDYDPDIILYTHIYAGIILDCINKNYGLRAEVVGVLTDFVFHPYWEEAQSLGYVVTASEGLLELGLKKGFKPEQIKPLGIPIAPKFATDVDKAEARRTLGLDEEKKTLLVMGGSMGYGNMAKTVRELDALDTDFQMIVVCGNNKSAYDKLQKLETKKKVLSFGFTDKVDLLMSASDLIVTKPGGISTSEAMAKSLPMILVNPIPGQEERNIDFFLREGAALAVSKELSLTDAVSAMLSDDELFAEKQKAVVALRKPNSTKDICSFALSLCEKN